MTTYIPPHKRHSHDGAAASSPPSPALPPDSVSSRFQRKPKDYGYKKIVYAEKAVNKWFVAGLDDDSLQALRLEQIDVDKPLSLRLTGNGVDARVSSNPWDFVVKTVKEDLISSFEHVKDEMKSHESTKVKPTLVVRFGRILFHGNVPTSLESRGGRSLPGSLLKQLRRSFYTNIPQTHMEYVLSSVVPTIGFEFEEEKELYHVKLSDKMRPDSTIKCKCTVAKDTNQLELRKVELNQVRQMVADVSCPDKDLDLRVMLCTMRILVALSDDDLENLKSLIKSARLDLEVKGGLRWPLGQQSSGDRYSVVGVWHTNAKNFRYSSMRLKVRTADRFDFISSQGETAQEVSVKLLGVLSQLQEEMVNTDLVEEMLTENLKLIWEPFLCIGSST